MGCGTGSLWVEAADHLPDGLSLTLTDLFPSMVSGARNRVQGKAKYAMVRAEQAGPIELSFEDGSFDVMHAIKEHAGQAELIVVSNQRDLDRVIDELARQPGTA